MTRWAETSDFQDRLTAVADQTEAMLESLLTSTPLPGETRRPARFMEAMRYASLGGGNDLCAVIAMRRADEDGVHIVARQSLLETLRARQPDGLRRRAGGGGGIDDEHGAQQVAGLQIARKRLAPPAKPDDRGAQHGQAPALRAAQWSGTLTASAPACPAAMVAS